jgi:8-amino-3,8-dideoxy-alpha-D-manno-octulosonate transaminase
LAKLEQIVVGQRAASAALSEALNGIPEVSIRTEPDDSYSTCDAFVFHVPDAAAAIRTRDRLLARGGGTKILPEAVTWHFAAFWNHMPGLAAQHGGNLRTAFTRSEAILGRSVAIPISATGGGMNLQLVREAVEEAIG